MPTKTRRKALTVTPSLEPNLFCYDAYDGGNDDPHAIKLRVSAEDRKKFDDLSKERDKWIAVTNIPDGKEYYVRRAPCGAGCFCAAEAKPKLG